MEIEFTGRQVKISKATRDSAQEGITRVGRILGPLTAASCILHEERHLLLVELHLQSRRHRLVAQGSSTTQAAAMRLALEHAESQALRFRDRLRSRKRKSAAVQAVDAVLAEKQTSRTKTRPTDAVKPVTKRVRALALIPRGRRTETEPHLRSAAEAVLPKPVTIEQAVKKAESEDRDLLIFRSMDGTQFVLHRQRDGHMAMVAIG